MATIPAQVYPTTVSYQGYPTQAGQPMPAPNGQYAPYPAPKDVVESSSDSSDSDSSSSSDSDSD